MIALQQLSSYFLPLGFGFVCDNALPATDLVFELVRPSRNNAGAFVAIRLEVCFGFAFAIIIAPSLHLFTG